MTNTLKNTIRKILRENESFMSDTFIPKFEKSLNILLSKKYKWFKSIRIDGLGINSVSRLSYGIVKLEYFNPVGVIHIDSEWVYKQWREYHYSGPFPDIEEEPLSFGDIIGGELSNDIQNYFKLIFSAVSGKEPPKWMSFSWLNVSLVDSQDNNLQESIKRVLRESDQSCNDKDIIQIANHISNKLHCDVFGSCVHFAELFVEKLYEINPQYLNCINVIEGYVDTPIGDGIPQQHTWVELNDGTKIDPTFLQFTKYGSVHYMRKKRTYTGMEYYEEGIGGTWFSEKRKKHPELIFKEQKETIRKILREETKPSLQLRRRINFDDLDKIFYISLSNVTERFLKYKSKFNAMQFYKFKSMVISEMIHNLGDTMSSSEQLTPIFDETWELITDMYSEKILERYNEIK